MNNICRIYLRTIPLKFLQKTFLKHLVPETFMNYIWCRHWILVFDYGTYKLLVQDDVQRQHSINTPSVTVDCNDLSSESDIYISTISLNMRKLIEMAYDNRFNGSMYELEKSTCQQWVLELSSQVGIYSQLLKKVREMENPYVDVAYKSIVKRLNIFYANM